MINDKGFVDAYAAIYEKKEDKDKKRWQDDDGDGKWYEKSDVDGKISKREKDEKKSKKKDDEDDKDEDKKEEANEEVVSEVWGTVAKVGAKGLAKAGAKFAAKKGGKAGGCSNTTRALAHSHASSRGYAEYVTIASTGNASEFGDWLVSAGNRGCCSGDGRGLAVGGGAASSLKSGKSSKALDYASVQRDNAEIQRRCQEVINTCTNANQNIIEFIHD